MIPVILVLLAYTIFQPSITDSMTNSSRWIRIPILGFGFQPSTLASIIILIYVARYLSKIKDKIITFSYATIDQVRKFYMKFFSKQGDRWDIFKKKCKSIKTTTALLQSFFFKYLNSDDIVSEIDDLKKMSQDKGVNTRNNLYL